MKCLLHHTLYRRLMSHLRHMQVWCESFHPNGTFCQTIDHTNTCTITVVYCAMCVIYKPNVSLSTATAPSVSPSTLSIYIYTIHWCYFAVVYCFMYVVSKSLCIKSTFCQPVDLANICTIHHFYSAVVYVQQYPLTTPIHVLSNNGTMPSNSRNATLPSSIVPWVSYTALVCQRHLLSAHRPCQDMHYPTMLLCCRLLHSYATMLSSIIPSSNVVYYVMCVICKPINVKGSLCQPIDHAKTHSIQQCCFTVIYCPAMLLLRRLLYQVR